MDKRRNSTDLSHGKNVSLAYLHERSILQKRLDQFEREQEKSIRKISNGQETLANALAVERGKNSSMEIQSVTVIYSPRQRPEARAGTLSPIPHSGNPENLENYTRLRKISLPSDISRYRKLSSSSVDTKSTKRATRQTSDPLQYSRQMDSSVIMMARRKLTTGQIGLAVSSKEFRPYSESHIFKSNLSKNQSKPKANFLSAKLPSGHATKSAEWEYSMEKIHLPTRLSSSANTPSRMVNETSAEKTNTYIKEGLFNASKKVDNRRKSSNGNFSSYEGLPEVINDNIEPQESAEENKIIQNAAAGALIRKEQFQNAKHVYLPGESPISELHTPEQSLISSELDLNLGSECDTGSESNNKSISRKASLSAASNKSKRHLHALTSETQGAGAREDVCYPGNAWSNNNSTVRRSRKIATVVAPRGIVLNDNSSVSPHEKNDTEQSSASDETGRNIDALRSFRRLALVAVAAERFQTKTTKPNSENRQIVLPEKKLLTKARLEELQRPTESYLRQIVADETSSKSTSFKSRSKSVSGISSGKTSVSGITNFRRVSQAAMATRILMDRRTRKVSGNRFSELESRKDKNQGKTLAEMMDELKDCRYLRNSTMDNE